MKPKAIALAVTSGIALAATALVALFIGTGKAEEEMERNGDYREMEFQANSNKYRE